MKNTKARMVIMAALIIVIIMIVILIVMNLLPTNIVKRSKQEELWGYVFSDSIESIIRDYTNGEDYNEILNDKKYESTISISFDPNIARKEDFNKYLKNLETNISEKVNNETKQSMGSVIVNYLTNQIFKLDYIRDNQTLGLKSDELVDRYLGIKNENLGELTKKIGWDFDLQPILFPEKKELLPNKNVTSKIKQDLEEVLSEQISIDKFKKQTERKMEMFDEQVTVDSYTIELNEEETYKIISEVLKKVVENDEAVTALKNNTIISLFGKNVSKDSIQSYIDQISSKEFSKETKLIGTLYILDKKMVKFEINVIGEGEKNDEYILETQEKTGTIRLTINKNEKDKNKATEIEFGKEGTGTDEVHYINIKNSENNEEKNKIIIRTKTEGSLADGDVTNRITVEYSYSDSNIKAKIENKIKIADKVEIENLNENNCAYANDMDENRIKYLYRVIYIGIQNLYEEKKNIITGEQLQQQTNPLDEAVKEHNAKFAMYDGEFSGKIVEELLNKVIKSNMESNYKVALKTKMNNENSIDLNNTEVTVENVQPIANLLNAEGTYIITIHYQEISGAIDEITIVKSGMEGPEEPPQVSIPVDDTNQQQNANQQQDTNQQQNTDQQQDTNQQQNTDQQQDTNQQQNTDQLQDNSQQQTLIQ